MRFKPTIGQQLEAATQNSAKDAGTMNVKALATAANKFASTPARMSTPMSDGVTIFMPEYTVVKVSSRTSTGTSTPTTSIATSGYEAVTAIADYTILLSIMIF